VPAGRLRGIQKSMIRQVFDRALPGSINLGLGEPDLPTPDLIRQAAVKVVTEQQNGYTSHAGLPTLRELVAADNSALGASTDDVIITAGSQEALYLALMSIVDHGDEVLVPDPGFVAYPTITRMAGGSTTTYRLPAKHEFGFDVESFKRSLTPRTKVVVCISPSNPTGRILSRLDLEEMARALEGSGIFVISDEIYRDLYFGEERPPSIAEFYPRTIVISGLSKSMSMTGWRLGWMCGIPDVIKSALVLHGYVTTCASAVSQKAALAAWRPEGEAARQRHRDTFRKRRDFLVEKLRTELDLQAVIPEGAFYAMVDVARFGDSMAVAQRMLEERVITVPGAAFGKEGEGFLRISFCAEEETIHEGIRRMKTALEALEQEGVV
jgi:aspartate aminotransferase